MDFLAFQEAAFARTANQRYDEYFRCYSSAMLHGPQRDNVNYGGKVIMPPSALDKLSRKNISYPMQFELRNNRRSTVTHAGVLEFIAEEGRIYLPHWMMKTLACEEGDLLQVLSTDLPQGTFVQLEPQSPAFLDISDPKAVLENTFRNFSTLTKGDIFQFSYNDNVYDVAVLQVKPESESMAIGVIETDLSVDFAAPKGYVEPTRSRHGGENMGNPGRVVSAGAGAGAMARKIDFDNLQTAGQAVGKFAGAGHKMSGKAIALDAAKQEGSAERASVVKRVPAPLRLPKGTLFFGYEVRLPKDPDAPANDQDSRVKFPGRGQSIKESNRKAKQESRGGSGRGEPIEID
ncbi:ubiquitin fusion degradation protein [Savitreella phatthalungensis]